eukprot:1160403-Pelagomonas_calceolata.AAC.10
MRSMAHCNGNGTFPPLLSSSLATSYAHHSHPRCHIAFLACTDSTVTCAVSDVPATAHAALSSSSSSSDLS